MKTIYIIGAYTASSKLETLRNIKKAEDAALRLWREGWCVICAHLNTACFNWYAPDIPNERWLKGGLELLRRSDAVYLLQGWEHSKGSKAECNLAFKLNKDIFYEEIH